MKANILSFADIEDMYKVTYKRGQTFVVHVQDRNVEFKCREKLYIVDWVVVSYVCVYTKEELRKAKEVYELVRNSGYPTPIKAMHLLTTYGWQDTCHAGTYSHGSTKSVHGVWYTSGVHMGAAYQEESE